MYVGRGIRFAACTACGAFSALYYNNSGDAAEHTLEHITLVDIRLTLRVIAEASPRGRPDADILFYHIAWHDVSL